MLYILQTCCPQYPIRLNVKNFKISKQQKNVYKTVKKYLDSLSKNKNENTNTNSNNENTISPHSSLQQQIPIPIPIPIPIENQNEITIETVLPEANVERFELYKLYQINIHGDNEDEITMGKQNIQK